MMITDKDPVYGYESVKPPRRQRNVSMEQAERIWHFRDKVVDYRIDNCQDGDVEASILAIVINKLAYAARHCECGEVDKAVGYMLDSRTLITNGALADEIDLLANDIAGHPLVCQCILPNQSCPVCRVAMSK